MLRSRNQRSLIAGVLLAVMALAAPIVAAEPGDMSLDEIAEKVRAYRKSLFEHQGGVEFSSTLSAIDNPVDEFAFKDSLSIKTAILWPKLLVTGTGQLNNVAEPYTRVAVYDFAKHETIGYDNFMGVIFPGRHLYSSGYGMMFRLLHLAEGSQQYQYGKPSPGLMTVPECFPSAKYRVLGEEAVNDVRCLVVECESEDPKQRDKIWLAADKGFLVHRRDRFDTVRQIREVTIIDEYEEASPRFYLPKKMTAHHYFGPDEKPERRGKLQMSMRLHIDLIQCGKVDPGQFQITFPEGLPVTDLTKEQ